MIHTGKVHKYWNQWYSIIQEDAPELLDEFIMDTAKKELFNKTQGVVEYLQTIGVKLPEPEAPAEEKTTEVVK